MKCFAFSSFIFGGEERHILCLVSKLLEHPYYYFINCFFRKSLLSSMPTYLWTCYPQRRRLRARRVSEVAAHCSRWWRHVVRRVNNRSPVVGYPNDNVAPLWPMRRWWCNCRSALNSARSPPNCRLCRRCCAQCRCSCHHLSVARWAMCRRACRWAVELSKCR